MTSSKSLNLLLRSFFPLAAQTTVITQPFERFSPASRYMPPILFSLLSTFPHNPTNIVGHHTESFISHGLALWPKQS